MPPPPPCPCAPRLADLHLRIGRRAAAKRALADAEALFHEVGALPAWDDAAIERTRGDLRLPIRRLRHRRRRRAQRALAGDLSDAGRARMCSQLGIAAMSPRRRRRRGRRLQQELEAYRRIGDPVSEASALGNLAEVALRRGDLVRGRGPPARRASRWRSSSGRRPMVAFSLIVAARIAPVDERWEEADHPARQAESSSTPPGSCSTRTTSV